MPNRKTIKKKSKLSVYNLLANIIEKIGDYAKDEPVAKYINMLNIDIAKIHFKMTPEHYTECKKMVMAFMKYPGVFREICRRIINPNAASKFDFLSMSG